MGYLSKRQWRLWEDPKRENNDSINRKKGRVVGCNTNHGGCYLYRMDVTGCRVARCALDVTSLFQSRA